MTDDQAAAAASISAEYREVLAHLRGARAALSKAEEALDLLGPADARPGSLDDLVVGIQTSADLVGRRTGTNERERVARPEASLTDEDRDALAEIEASAALTVERLMGPRRGTIQEPEADREPEQREAGQ